jgi:hypothetical protein
VLLPAAIGPLTTAFGPSCANRHDAPIAANNAKLTLNVFISNALSCLIGEAFLHFNHASLQVPYSNTVPHQTKYRPNQ